MAENIPWLEAAYNCVRVDNMVRVFTDMDLMRQLKLEMWERNLLWGVIAYIAFQPVLRFIFKDGRFYDNYKGFWKKFMAVYNFAMSAYSGVTCVLAAKELYRTGVWVTQPGEGPFESELFAYLAHLFFLSKYVEYLDTAFLIIAGKPVSWLQYFHHIGAPLDLWALGRAENVGTWIFVAFNSFIHFFMYMYFGFSALSIHLTPLKWIMTSLQLLQLTVGTYISCYLPAYLPWYRANNDMMFGWYFSTAYTLVLVVLFAEFFISSYIVKKDRRPKKPVKAE